jgi:hypothetical protein
MKTLSLYVLRNHTFRESQYCFTFGSGSDCIKKYKEGGRGKSARWDWKRHKITCERVNFQIKLPTIKSLDSKNLL